MDLKLPLAGIVIALGYILMVVIDTVMQKCEDTNVETENTAAEKEEQKEDQDLSEHGSKITLKPFQLQDEKLDVEAVDKIMTAKVSP